MSRCACFLLLALAAAAGGSEDCENGIDDDGDGFVDLADFDCFDWPDPEHCGNARDDDGDGMVDCEDPDCGTDHCFCDAGASVFIRGDADSNGTVDMADAMFLLRYLFRGRRAPDCLDAADADNSNSVQITDVVLILRYLFQGGGPPEPPFPSCGADHDRHSEWRRCRQAYCCP